MGIDMIGLQAPEDGWTGHTEYPRGLQHGGYSLVGSTIYLYTREDFIMYLTHLYGYSNEDLFCYLEGRIFDFVVEACGQGNPQLPCFGTTRLELEWNNFWCSKRG